jgi:hypothetical protein
VQPPGDFYDGGGWWGRNYVASETFAGIPIEMEYRHWFYKTTPEDPLNGGWSNIIEDQDSDDENIDNELINSTDYYSDDETNTNDIKKDKLIMEFKDNDISEESIENSHTHICESNGEHNHDTTNWDDETAPPSISMVPFIKY